MAGRILRIHLLSGEFRGRTPEKGDAMPEAVYALAITLLVALLVIDRLAR
jgi:hypothetical protein